MNRPSLHLRPDDRTTPAMFSAAEFVGMCEAGAFADMKVELIGGELHRMPPPGNDHSRRQTQLAIRLAAAVGEALVRIEIGMILGEGTVVGCDAVVLRAPTGRSGMLEAEEAALVIEVAETTSARDTTLKRTAYAAAGVDHYWVVDGARSVVHLYARAEQGDYVDATTARFGEPIALPGIDATIVVD